MFLTHCLDAENDSLGRAELAELTGDEVFSTPARSFRAAHHQTREQDVPVLDITTATYWLVIASACLE